MALEISIGERIRLILDRLKVSERTVATWLEITPQRLSQKFKDNIWDSISEVMTIAKMTRYNFEWLVHGTGPEKEDDDTAVDTVANVSVEYLKGKNIRPLTIVTNPSGQELVTFVPVKARAGYMRGYSDPGYVERLPAFSLPGVIRDATYRMFEVEGDSMLQLGSKGMRQGDVVIAKYVEDIFTLRDNRVYVVVSTEGIAIKRVLNRLRDKDSPCLVMTSDNKNGEHPNYILKPKQILEAWEAKKFISGDFSFDTNLYEIIGDIQAEQAKLKEKVDQIEKSK